MAICPDTESLPPLDDDRAIELAEMFRLLGDPSRLRIVLETLGEPRSVGDIAGRLGLSLSLVSHHLRLLRAARLVSADRRGKQIFYSIHDAHVAHVIRDMVAHVNEEPE
ncbi:metalloregulator ArsR/SmtB family transcription factor [Parvibaculum sp.]|jgi:DNA-binding transcriptional ArsR family regulator|uniref:ArsR/SmtB family transcription factor n=1 Tax=Parvibaculum sp. TaxID=2024848 RepID=UPI000C943550|nr:metalloregulator ArsR/SmtB family transcription factor [Parvibaculum sp.]MAB12385.1 transcriptional regulator [Parvibaculum sp.]